MTKAARAAFAILTLALLLAPIARAQTAVPASRQADDVVIITVRGAIDRWTELSVKRRIAQAEQSNADAFVIEVDSPGGEVGAVLEICNAIKGSSIANSVAWVHPDAYSGGAIIALACREIVTSDPARMGDAFPITFGPTGVRGLSPDERTKFLPPLLTEVADSARRSGYDEFLVQAMIVDGLELWSVRDSQTGRRWFINEAEYRTLFDGDPPRGKPLLTGVTKGRAADQAAPRPDEPKPAPTGPDPETDPETGPQADNESPSPDDPAATDPGDAEQPAVQPAAAQPADGAEPTDAPNTPTPTAAPAGPAAFTPAGPAVADLADSVSETLTAESTRPTFSAADRGRYIDPVYVTDGTGPIVLTEDQLIDFGFSSAIVQDDADLQAFFAAKRMIRTEQTWSEAMVRFMMNPIVRGLLIVTLLIGLFVEMSSPGAVVPGAFAVAALVGLIAPPMLVGMAGWWEIVALSLGIVLVLVELLVIPGFGVFGILGLIGLFTGLVGTFIPDGSGGLFDADSAAASGLFSGVVTVLLATVTAGIGIYFLAKHFGSVPFLGRLILADTDPDAASELLAMAPPPPEPMPGDRGTARSPLRPSGRVEVGGIMHDAIAQRGYIDAGQPVEVVARRAFSIVVRPAPTATQPQPTPDPAPEDDIS